MRRREFIEIAGAAGAWPFVARAARAQGKVPVIGFLGTTTRTAWSKPALNGGADALYVVTEAAARRGHSQEQS